MLNICVPMAGKGQRFADAGYLDPKPFIKLNENYRLINKVVENLTPYEPHRFIFIARREHEGLIKQHLSFASNVIYVDEVTQGAACTVLLANKLIDNGDPLVIANSDQLVKWNKGDKVHGIGDTWWKESNNVQDMLNNFRNENLAAGIATFPSSHPKWSYAQVDHMGRVHKVKEKEVISNVATVGIYYWKCGSYFVQSAKEMIDNDERHNGEFYVAPTLNYTKHLEVGHIGIYDVNEMFGLGTPEDLKSFQASLWDGAVFL